MFSLLWNYLNNFNTFGICKTLRAFKITSSKYKQKTGTG